MSIESPASTPSISSLKMGLGSAFITPPAVRCLQTGMAVARDGKRQN
jgi:hypothetical protein